MSDADDRSRCSDSSDGGSSLDEPPPVKRADMPVGSLEAFAARQRAKMMAGGGVVGGLPPMSIQLSTAAASAPPKAVTPGNSTCAGAEQPTAANGKDGQQQQQAANKQGQLHRLNIFVLVRILFHYLEKVDQKLLLQAKQVLKECDKQKKSGNPEFQNLADAIPPRIKACVGDHHWLKALAIQRQFLKSKQKQTRQATSSSSVSPATARLVAQHQAAQQQRSEIVARKFAQAGVLATNEVGVPLGAVPAASPKPQEARPSLRRHVGRKSQRRIDTPGSGRGGSVSDDDDESDSGDEGTTSTQHHSLKHGRSQSTSPAAADGESVRSGDNRRGAVVGGDSSSTSVGEKRGACHHVPSSSNASDRMVEDALAAPGGGGGVPSPPSAGAAKTSPLSKHKRVASAPYGTLGVTDSLMRRESSQDSFMRFNDNLRGPEGYAVSGVSPDKAAGQAPTGATALGRMNEYRGQEQQAAPQRRRRNDTAVMMRPVVSSPSPPPAPVAQGIFGLSPSQGAGSGGSLNETILVAAQGRGQPQTNASAPTNLNHFSLTGSAKPFFPSGYTLFSHTSGRGVGPGPVVVSGGSTPPPQPSPLDTGAPTSLCRAGSGSALPVGGGGGNIPMDTRNRADSLACSDDSSDEEAAVVDVEEDEIDDGTMLRSARVRADTTQSEGRQETRRRSPEHACTSVCEKGRPNK